MLVSGFVLFVWFLKGQLWAQTNRSFYHLFGRTGWGLGVLPLVGAENPIGVEKMEKTRVHLFWYCEENRMTVVRTTQSLRRICGTLRKTIFGWPTFLLNEVRQNQFIILRRSNKKSLKLKWNVQNQSSKTYREWFYMLQDQSTNQVWRAWRAWGSSDTLPTETWFLFAFVWCSLHCCNPWRLEKGWYNS